MTKPTDKIRIDVTISAEEALRARVVLGRTNGAAEDKLYHELVKKLDPEGLYDPFFIENGIGTVEYRLYETDYRNYFFGLYSDKAKQKRHELSVAEKELIAITAKIAKLKQSLGE